MSRIRSIKPEFWTSEQVVECSPTARLLFIGFWNFADDNGVLPASAKLLKMLVFPGDDFRVDQVRGFADELLDQGLIAEFSDDAGRNYWFVTGWKKHQKIDKPSNKYPAPPLEFRDSPLVRQPFVEHSPSTLRTFVESSATERSGEEGRGREEEGRGREEERAPADAAAAATPGANSPPVAATIPIDPQPDTAKPSKPVKAKKARALEPLPDSPDWLPADAWQRFIRHRQDIKHPLTIDAAELTLRDLNTARAFGHDPVALIADAVRNGWRGCVYPDRHHQPKSALPGGGRAPRKAVAAPAVATTAAGAEFATILNAMTHNRPVIEGEVIHAAD